MKQYIITTEAGTRLWHADNEEHAREQHMMDFSDEEILGVREVEQSTLNRVIMEQGWDSDDLAALALLFIGLRRLSDDFDAFLEFAASLQNEIAIEAMLEGN